MNFPGDAANWLDVIDHGIVVLGAVIVAMVPGWLTLRNHRAIKTVDAKADTIKSQIVNGHEQDPEAPKLRDDLDGLKAAMARWEPVLGMVNELREGMEALSHQMRSFRADLMAEEDRRRIQISDLRQEIDHRTGKRGHP